MANGYFERGEVYWVRVDAGIGVETGVGRPAVIISNDKANTNSECVNMAWTTTQEKDKPWDIVTYATGRKSWIMCNQIITVDKSRLGKMIGVLPPEDMRKVDDALEDQFDLGYTDDTALKEKETEIAVLNLRISEMKEEISKLNEQLAKHEDDASAHRVEVEMWQRLYDRALDQVCNMKLTGDIARRAEKKQPEQPKPQPKEEPKVEVESGLVDINSASFDALKACGLSNNLILQIVNRRPHKSVEDLKKIPGFTSVLYGIVSKKICCVVPKVKTALPQPDPGYEQEGEVSTVQGPKVAWDGVKVNVNTVKTGTELHKRTGLVMKAATEIVKHRKQFGNYQKLEDLTNLKNFGSVAFKRYAHMLEV